jgi:hypothetical protein
MEFTISEQTNSSHTYYAMTLYSYSFGLTDRRKPEFKILITTTKLALGQQLQPESLVQEQEASVESSMLENLKSWTYEKMGGVAQFFRSVLQ